MNNSRFKALIAAILFGASTPFAKILLGNVEPIPLAGLLYLGCGLTLLIFKLFQNNKSKETQLEKSDYLWLMGAIIAGGILAPIVLLFSLQNTSAATASLLLNFEAVATTLIAGVFFKEYIGKSVVIAIVFITLAGIFLSFDFSSAWGISLGALGIILACILWGLDNNFTRNISSKDPVSIVMVKGLAAGCFSIILAFLLQQSFPAWNIIVYALILGAFSYGLSLLLFITALKDLGASRTSALYGIAPFFGAILSFILVKSDLQITFYFSIPLMVAGAYLILKEQHEHLHHHEVMTHNHKHRHDDGHHNHVHENMSKDLEHSHEHTHEAMEHDHPHTPDIHHRHAH